jgi:hypothetical protein
MSVLVMYITDGGFSRISNQRDRRTSAAGLLSYPWIQDRAFTHHLGPMSSGPICYRLVVRLITRKPVAVAFDCHQHVSSLNIYSLHSLKPQVPQDAILNSGITKPSQFRGSLMPICNTANRVSNHTAYRLSDRQVNNELTFKTFRSDILHKSMYRQ